MKATGIVRRVDDLGRVVIPKELRRTMGIPMGQPMEIFVTADSIVFKKYRADESCIVCGEFPTDRREMSGKTICTSCMNKAWAMMESEGESNG